jgi:hypothetical protein
VDLLLFICIKFISRIGVLIKLLLFLLNVGNALGTAPKSYVDLAVNNQASASDRKAAVTGAAGVAMTTAENYFANVRNSAACATSFRVLGGVAPFASLQVS